MTIVTIATSTTDRKPPVCSHHWASKSLQFSACVDNYERSTKEEAKAEQLRQERSEKQAQAKATKKDKERLEKEAEQRKKELEKKKKEDERQAKAKAKQETQKQKEGNAKAKAAPKAATKAKAKAATKAAAQTETNDTEEDQDEQDEDSVEDPICAAHQDSKRQKIDDDFDHGSDIGSFQEFSRRLNLKSYRNQTLKEKMARLS